MPLAGIDSRYPALVRAGGFEIALCRIGDDVYAVANVCTHAYGLLTDGEVCDYEIVCPLHGGSFDVRTGAPVELPCDEPIQTFPTKVEDGDVFIKI